MLTKIRNNPKKIIFFGGVLCYGAYYVKEKFRENALRRQFCGEAKKFGDGFIHPLKELTRVTVIHNPSANQRKSDKLFKDNIYPLLNLNGYKVTVIETNRAEEAKELMAVIKPEDQDCVFIAGGDGTLMEVVTGLLRRSDLRYELYKIPLVSSPLGNTNSFVSKWNQNKFEDSISNCNESVKLIEKSQIKPTSALSIHTIHEEKPESENTSVNDDDKQKEIYGLTGLEWSVDRDVFRNGKRKWLFGPYRLHFQYFLTGLLGKNKSTNKTATLVYREDCQGCSKCISVNNLAENSNAPTRNILRSILGFIFPMSFVKSKAKEKERNQELEEKGKIINENCGVIHEKRLVDVRGLSVVLDENKMKIQIKKQEPDLAEYIKSGINKLKDKPYDVNSVCDEYFECSELRIIPETATTIEKFYIDNEELDVVPIELKVLKNALYFYS